MKNHPFFIGFAGASGSGKTTVSEEIGRRIDDIKGEGTVTFVSLDFYYKDQGHVPSEERASIDFDHPDALDWTLIDHHFQLLKAGEVVMAPQYDFNTHTRSMETLTIQPARVVIIDGILLFWLEQIRDMFNLKFFVDVPLDECLARRILRDIRERGRTVESVIEQWLKTAKPGFEHFVFPTKKYADLIIPKGGGNEEAIDTIVSRIISHL